MDEPTRSAQNRFQRAYFENVDRPRMALADTPYVRRHVEELIARAPLAPGARLLEIGAGLGKFTLPLLDRGFEVTANDISPVMLADLRRAARHPVETLACDAADIARHVGRPYDAAIGFFVLHHLVDFDATFAALAAAVRPGGCVAFCEPVGWNPLYYVQIAVTPRMTFAGEVSLRHMRPGRMLPALERAGFVQARSERYGYFPPVLKNTRAGSAVEAFLERVPWLPFPHAFQVFAARRPA